MCTLSLGFHWLLWMMREPSKRGDGREAWCSARLSWGEEEGSPPPRNSRRATEASPLPVFSRCSVCVPNQNAHDSLPRIRSPFGDSVCPCPPANALHGPHGPPGGAGDTTAPAASRVECGLAGPCGGHRLIASASCSRRVSRAYPGGHTQLYLSLQTCSIPFFSSL